MTIDGDIAPEQKRDALGSATILEDAHACGHALLVRGQKEHGDAVFALVGKYAAAFLRLLAKEAMRHLDEYARAITRVGLEANTTAMFEIDENRKRVVDDLMRTHALEVCQRPDAARVMLELAAVQRRICTRTPLGPIRHLSLHTHTSS